MINFIKIVIKWTTNPKNLYKAITIISTVCSILGFIIKSKHPEVNQIVKTTLKKCEDEQKKRKRKWM
ncbi:MAG: hypothetical protein LUD48_05115 [Prevotella sp.]|nr:hypothetical protein [Prevotella sp.]